uniref:Uncharacterized protein n=1 Tax=Desertifilum tharense IPPAS B-1220 TaxID=1781255 RepID=A0A1E5QQA7_9CYAN|nr:hypothetical protein BH720_02350 [Desertifilum tharense IPPAS B-1220]
MLETLLKPVFCQVKTVDNSQKIINVTKIKLDKCDRESSLFETISDDDHTVALSAVDADLNCATNMKIYLSIL